jgi:predicted MFS family arabinose efflux permease
VTGAGVTARGTPLLAYISGGFGLGLSGMLSILVPLRANELGASVATIGAILAVRAVTELVLAVPLGGLIGRIGTRSAYLVGTAWSAAVAVGFALSDSYLMLLVLSALIGAGRILAWVSSQSHISSAGGVGSRARDTAKFSFVSHCSQIVSPALAGAAGHVFGYQLAFLAVAGYSLVFYAVGLGLRRHGADADRGPAGLAALLAMTRQPRVQSAMLMSFVLLWVPSIWSPFFPLFLVKGGMSPVLAGTVVSAMGLVAAVLTLVSGMPLRWLSADRVCRLALTVSSVGLLVSPMLMSLPLAFAPAVLIGVGQGLGLPLLIVLVSSEVPVAQRGLALGARAAVNSTASMTAPLAVGPLVAALGLGAGFGIAGLGAGLLLVVSAVLAGRDEAESTAPT